MQSRIDRQIGQLTLARSCALLGARARTISLLTGVSRRQVRRLCFGAGAAAPRGRAPDSPEWYHGANLLQRAEASIVAGLYEQLRAAGFAAEEALPAAYGHYQRLCPSPRISFDRAFDLAAHLDGRWLARSPSLALLTCPRCQCRSLQA